MVKFINGVELVTIEGEEELIERFKIDRVNLKPNYTTKYYGYTEITGHELSGYMSLYKISSPTGRLTTKSIIESLYTSLKIFPNNYDWHYENIAGTGYSNAGYIIFAEGERKKGIIITKADLSKDDYTEKLEYISTIFRSIDYKNLLNMETFKHSLNTKILLKPRFNENLDPVTPPSEDTVSEYFMYEFTYSGDVSC